MLFGTGVPDINKNGHSAAMGAYFSHRATKKVRKSNRNHKDKSHHSLNVKQKMTHQSTKKQSLVKQPLADSVETFSAAG